jgi:hypothetical protein
MLEEEFFQEIREAYTKEHEIRSNLDDKANNMMSVSGTIATLFMGFGSFLLQNIPMTKLVIVVPAFIILMIEIILTTITIRYSMNAFKIRGYYYPVTYNAFFKNGKYDPMVVKLFITAEKDSFYQHFIGEYLTGIRTNVAHNLDKSKKIGFAQRLFLFALAMIPIFAFVIIISKFVP